MYFILSRWHHVFFRVALCDAIEKYYNKRRVGLIASRFLIAGDAASAAVHRVNREKKKKSPTSREVCRFTQNVCGAFARRCWADKRNKPGSISYNSFYLFFFLVTPYNSIRKAASVHRVVPFPRNASISRPSARARWWWWCRLLMHLCVLFILFKKTTLEIDFVCLWPNSDQMAKFQKYFAILAHAHVTRTLGFATLDSCRLTQQTSLGVNYPYQRRARLV